LGYYEIPRRQKTEDLARILDMDTATIGEHIRRAEKHVFDELFQ
jgi:predicted DNA binding protein